MKRLAFCAAAAILGGCATVDRIDGNLCKKTVDGMVPVEVVQVMNTNWRLLSCIPLGSGNPDMPNECSCRMFHNTVTLQNQLRMIEAEARRVGAKRAVNVTSDRSSESVLFFLLKREKLHTSAVLVKDHGPIPVETSAQ